MVVVLEVQGLGALKVPVQDLETKEVLLFSLWDPVSPVVPGLDVVFSAFSPLARGGGGCFRLAARRRQGQT